LQESVDTALAIILCYTKLSLDGFTFLYHSQLGVVLKVDL